MPTTETLQTAGIWAAVLTLISVVVRAWPRLKEIAAKSDATLLQTLMGRVGNLEAANVVVSEKLDAERTRHGEEITLLRDRHDAEMRLLRHRLANEAQTTDALLNIFEMSGILDSAPQRLRDAVAAIRKQRSDRATLLAEETSIIIRQRIAADKDAA